MSSEGSGLRWKRIDKKWQDYRDEARRGVVIELADGKRYLIGDVNVNGGFCDDCPINDLSVVEYELDVSAVVETSIREASLARSLTEKLKTIKLPD